MKDTGRQLFKVAVDNQVTSKDRVVRLFKRRANRYFGDRRRVNHVMTHTNRLGETFLFGRYGHRKNTTMLTIGQFIAPGFLKLERL